MVFSFVLWAGERFDAAGCQLSHYPLSRRPHTSHQNPYHQADLVSVEGGSRIRSRRVLFETVDREENAHQHQQGSDIIRRTRKVEGCPGTREVIK